MFFCLLKFALLDTVLCILDLLVVTVELGASYLVYILRLSPLDNGKSNVPRKPDNSPQMPENPALNPPANTMGGAGFGPAVGVPQNSSKNKILIQF